MGICVGDRCGAGVTEAESYAGEGAKSPRRWRKRSAVGMALRPGPLGGQFCEPGLNPLVQGTPPPGIPGQRPSASSLPSIAFPKGYIPKPH